MNDEVLSMFVALDTRKQLGVLQRVGLDTECADRLLGHLAGHDPMRFAALKRNVDLVDKYGYGAANAA